MLVVRCNANESLEMNQSKIKSRMWLLLQDQDLKMYAIKNWKC